MNNSRMIIIIIFYMSSLIYPYDGEEIQVYLSSELLPESSIWYTNPPDQSEIKYKLDKQESLRWGKINKTNNLTISINPKISYQSILGIGTSLEATTINAISKGKTDEQIRQIINLLIDPQDGLGFNMFRITIGTSDFSDGRKVSSHPKGFYTYQDDKENFSIEPDKKTGIIKIIKLVQDVAANLDPPQSIIFFAAPWSAPAWMKTSEKLIGGTLKKGYEKQYANYLRNFVEAYEDEGIPIYAISIQNEPNFLPDSYPGMKLSVDQQLDLTIATYEEFHNPNKTELHTKLWLNDHNFEDWVNADYILNELKKNGKDYYASGTAFHNYTNFPAAYMSKLYKNHPEHEIIFTEHSEWGISGMYNIQNYFWNWSRSYMYWVTMTTHDLDEYNQGPYNNLNDLSPTLLIENPNQSDKWYVTPEFYLLGNFSKFIRPGAYRIDCDMGNTKELSFVAFRNSDGTIVLIATNLTKELKDFTFLFNNKSSSSSVPPKSIATYLWIE